jgi:hypothetical protein
MTNARPKNGTLMPIERYSDWELRLARQDAFWAGAVIDRPVASIAFSAPNPLYPRPASRPFASRKDRWLDPEYQAEQAVWRVMNTAYCGDALPAAYPNLGPEVFSAYYGQEMEYGEHTSWSIPCLHDWAAAPRLQFSEDNFYWRRTMEMTDALLAAGRGIFYTGLTDLHPGGDAVAAFRDPQNLNLDLIDYPHEVKQLLGRLAPDFSRIFDTFVDKLQNAGQPISTWAGPVSTRRWHVPSNDFSCMVSKAMFDEFFLPGIAAECRHAEASIYHLDGPNALQHLDSLLSIPELNAIQWVYGAGNGRSTDWLDVYRRCRAAGKGIQLSLEPDEVEPFIAEFPPEGLWLILVGIRSQEEADAVLRRLARWTS